MPPAITSLPSLQTFKRACIEDGTVSEIVRQCTLADTSLIHDIYCGPEVLCQTCVAMKSVDDDDDEYESENVNVRVNVDLYNA